MKSYFKAFCVQGADSRLPRDVLLFLKAMMLSNGPTELLSMETIPRKKNYQNYTLTQFSGLNKGYKHNLPLV
jgi:hypothetical protein